MRSVKYESELLRPPHSQVTYDELFYILLSSLAPLRFGRTLGFTMCTILLFSRRRYADRR